MSVPARRFSRWPSVALIASIAACGGDDAPQASRSPFTVWVFDEGLGAGESKQPLADVEVDFDPPDGAARVRARTAADGHVVFDADFTKAGGTVTVVSPDHVIVSALDASPQTARARPNDAGKPPEDLVLVMPRLDAAIRASTIDLRGMIAGKDDGASVDVSASGVRRLGSSYAKDPTYILRAPRARPFFLVAHEISSTREASGASVNELTRSARIDVPPHDADTVLDVDLSNATPLPLRQARVRATFPPGGPFGADGSCSATVHGADSTLLAGIFRKSTKDATGCDLEMTVAETEVAPDTLLTSAVLVAPDGSRSERTEVGVLASSATLDDFVAPPVVADVSRSLREPIAIEGLPAGADVRVDVFAGDQLLWVLRSPPGGLPDGVLHVPLAPVSFSADVVLLALAITAELDRVVLPSGTEVYRRTATSRDVVVRR